MTKYGQPQQLENYGAPGHITSLMQGKQIESLMYDGHWLVIRTVCGHEARVGWADANGSTQNQGRPFLENLDCRIVLPSVSSRGSATGPA